MSIGLAMNDKEFSITFEVQGYVKQFVTMIDQRITLEQLQVGLRCGKYATTIQENGYIIEVATMKNVARVTNVDNFCEYNEFEVEER